MGISNRHILLKNGSIYWNPQIWYLSSDGSLTQMGYYVEWVGDISYLVFYVRIDLQPPGYPTYTRYRIYIYRTFKQFDYDAPTIKTVYSTHTDPSFLYGYKNQVVGGQERQFRFFQYGVESQEEITTTQWEVLNSHVSYYDSTTSKWKFFKGYSTTHEKSCITWNGNYWALVGGCNYNGVNKKYSGSQNMVCWKRTGASLPDNTNLWSTTGDNSDVVSSPYMIS